MSHPRASALSSGVLLAAILSGCGKAQPRPNQVAIPAAGAASADSGTGNLGSAVYQPHTDVSTTAPQAPGGRAAPAAAPTASGSASPGPTAIGSTTSGPLSGPNLTGPTVASPTLTGAAASGAVATQASPAATTNPPTPLASATPASPGSPSLTQPNSATAVASGAVASGDMSGLAAAVNKWRMQGGNLAGVKRLEDKPVVAGYSWMTHLLPYLGHGDLYGKIDFAKGWHDAANIQTTGQLIPAFIDPANPSHHMAVIGAKKGEVGPAFTHFVGMAGVEDSRNLVAAALPRSDPRAGIFGYDQIARPGEITDGGGNTIMMIAAGRIVGPWASGGGATIRGARAPYFDSITGFGSVGDPGGGALVAMADGSVKRISKDIDPAVFRALCTIHGGETIDLSAHANVIRSQ